jgi:hypothetical protein
MTARELLIFTTKTHAFGALYTKPNRLRIPVVQQEQTNLPSLEEKARGGIIGQGCPIFAMIERLNSAHF